MNYKIGVVEKRLGLYVANKFYLYSWYLKVATCIMYSYEVTDFSILASEYLTKGYIPRMFLITDYIE